MVAEDPEITVAETVIRLAGEHGAQVIVGAHVHGGLLGSTFRAVVTAAPCPALLVRVAPNSQSP